MLTACPKCHHLFVQPGGGRAADANAQQGENGGAGGGVSGAGRQCCPAAVMTLHVPCAMTGWTGGSVMLQKGGGGATNTDSKTTRSPEPSPSVALSFVLPTTPTVIMARPEDWSFTIPSNNASVSNQLPQSEMDLQRLSWTSKALKISGWYYEGLSWQESVSALMTTSPGTFLVRDSSDPRYLFSLSVQTERGPTSVRLHYSNGHFRLDAEPKLVPVMPVFDCVVKLIEHYVRVTEESHSSKRKRSKDQVLFIDSAGQMYSHILLTRPLRQKDRFPTLTHLARLTINRFGSHVPTAAGLPVSLNNYLAEYPYTC